MNRSESKYFATAAKIDEAFLTLLDQKDFSNITVKEICLKAGVNRSTFYLHYETISDLLAESAQFIIDKLITSMPQDIAKFFNSLQSYSLEELILITPDYLMPYLNFIKEHRRLFQTALAHSDVLGWDKTYSNLNRHVFMPILDRFCIPSAKQPYIMQFYINGLMGIIKEWLKNDCKDSCERIISIIQICVPNHP